MPKRGHTSFTRWCDPLGVKHRQLARQVGVLRVFSSTSHLFLDGHSHFTDPALHGDLVQEPRVHVHRFWLRHDPALGQRTKRTLQCTRTIEGPIRGTDSTATATPAFHGHRLMPGERWSRSRQPRVAKPRTGGPTSRGPRDGVERRHASRAPVLHDAVTARVVHP